MQSRVLRLSEMDLDDRLTVEHYVSPDLVLMKRLRKGAYPLTPLGNLAVVKGGKRLPSKAKYSPSGVPYIRVVDFGKYEIELENVVYISQDLYEQIKRYQLHYNDIGIVIVGATIGKVAIFKSKITPCNFNENLARITVRKKSLSPDYLLAFLQSRFGQAYISWLTGGAAQAKLSLTRIRRIRVPVPPRNVQDRIAQIMQDAHATRQAKLTQAHQLLGNIDDFVFESLNISPQTVSEETRFVKSSSEIQSGRFDVDFNMGFHKFDPYLHLVQSVQEVAVFPTEKRNPTTEPDRPFNYIDISSIDVQTGEVVEVKEIMGSDAPSRARQVVHTFDIIVSTVRPTRGATAIIPTSMGNYICSTGFTVVRSNGKVLPEYLHIALRLSTTREQFGRRSSGSSYPAILQRDIEEVLIPVPDPTIQKKIADEVIDRKKKVARLRQDAEDVVVLAKEQVERMILGEEA